MGFYTYDHVNYFWDGKYDVPGTSTPWNHWTATTPVLPETHWQCIVCGTKQLPSEVRTIEIIEPGKAPRTEYHGKIRPTSFDVWQEFTCLVCGHVWNDFPDDEPDPDEPETKTNVFPFPIHEDSACCTACDREAC